MPGKRTARSGDEALVAEYIQWIIGLFEHKVGEAVYSLALVSQSISVVKVDRRRSAANEDFVALFATEMAERIAAIQTIASDVSASDQFLRLLKTTSDTVRHRIVREARRHSGRDHSAVIEQLPAALPAQRNVAALVQQLMQSLDLDECFLVVSHYLDGEPLETIAKSFGWSRRTAYRRLDAVIQKMRRFAGNDVVAE